MSLQELINDNKLSKIENVSSEDVKAMFSRAVRFFNDVKKSLKYGGDDLVNYTNIYDAIRIAGEAFLLFHGYRARKGGGYHYIVIRAVSKIINGELSGVFKRIEKMRSKRNRIEYGVLEVSRSELIQAIDDAEKFILKVDKLIKAKDSQKSFI
jgi:uncharacterized protein (UPF0332 family)